MTKVEEVARALCADDHPEFTMVPEIMGNPDFAPGHEGDAAYLTAAGRYRRRARAAILAMREPSARMVSDGEAQDSEMLTPWSTANIYRSMIDAALSE